MDRKPLVAANWKMNGSIALCAQYTSELVLSPEVDYWVFPPVTHVTTLIGMLAERPTEMRVGVQNVHQQEVGAFTGEISAKLAAEIGATLAIIGHSERRSYFGETSELVAHKTNTALEVGLNPIVCVGEQLEEKSAGKATEVVKGQLMEIAQNCPATAWDRLTIAYEPVWAIGSGESATPAYAQAMHRTIRDLLKTWSADLEQGVRIVYGGSVNPANAQELVSQPDIDGFLVGGASLQVADFSLICQAVETEGQIC